MKKQLISFSLLLATVVGFAQVDRSKMPEAGPAPKIQLGDIESFTLENGLKVFVVENIKLPRVTFSLRLDIDPLKEGDKAGTADLAGDLISKGTASRSKEDFNFQIDYIGATFGTSASSVFGRSLKKHQETLLELMSDVVLNAKMDAAELEKLKKQYISGIQTEKDDPDAIASNVERVLLYGKDHPYGEIMTEESVNNINLEDVKNYYQTYFKPNVAYLAVVGDITVKEAKPLVKKYFGNWKKGEVPTFDYPAPKKPERMQVVFVNKPGAVQSVISVMNTLELEPGDDDDIPAMIANGILGGGFTSKLNLNLREKNSFTYGARSFIDSDELIGSFGTSAKVRNEVTDSALAETMNEIKAMLNGNITQDELTTIKNYRTGIFAIRLENPQTIANFAINTERYDLDEDYYENYLKKIESVDLDKIKAVSKKYITPNNGYVLVVGNQEEVAEKVKALFGQDLIFMDNYGNVVEETSLKAAPAGMTAKDVINKHLEAIGGVKKLEKVTSLEMEMKTSIQGMPLVITTYNKSPRNYKMTVDMNGNTMQSQTLNNGKGVSASPQGKMPMNEEQVKESEIEAMMFPELAYLKADFKAALKGVDKKEGKEVYVVEITKPGGKKQTNFYAVESGLLYASEKVEETPMGAMTMTDVFTEYQTVDGIKFYKKFKRSGPPPMEVEVVEVEVNKDLDDELFKLD